MFKTPTQSAGSSSKTPVLPKNLVLSKNLVPPKQSDFVETLKARATYDLNVKCDLETLLNKMCWYAYRDKTPLDRTCDFVKAYDRAAFNYLTCAAEISTHVKKLLTARGHYLKPNEYQFPWIAPNKTKHATTKFKLSPRWTSFVKARRAADKRCMSYDDYCEAAISVALARGWPGIPYPQQLCDDRLLGKADNYVEATIPAFVDKRHAETIQLCDRFSFPQDRELSQIERDYVRFVARQIVDLYGENQRAERAWRGYQKHRHVPGSLGLFDALKYE